ncbi:helix-turn-helix transcriptional regulator [Paraglaciecola marina]|uniref:helix-turn-helix transcriptional regulator n=1 Tax=Paraglaciecola marina TaxID=2500157 RepID=UPI00105FA65E|nr:AlpA family phage regulatory protein [Paraglaciecola marina]
MDIKPQNEIIKLNDVMKLIPYSRTSIYRLMTEGVFPKSVNLGSRSVFWIKSDIEDYIQTSIDNSKKEAA